MSVITLLSDYGLDSSTVGAIKGTLLKHAPRAVLIDLTHQIPPQSLLVARFELMTAYRSFPKGTVHLAIVDPGAAEGRRAVAFRTADFFFVGPDNGLFDGVLDIEPALEAVEFVTPALATRSFRGRDVFAPIAASLAEGAELGALGRPVLPETLARFDINLASRTQDGIHGQVQIVDHFGNLVTNIPGDWLAAPQWEIRIAGHRLTFCPTGCDRSGARLQAQVASHGFLQLAFEGDNCARRLGVTVGQLVVTQPIPEPRRAGGEVTRR